MDSLSDTGSPLLIILGGLPGTGKTTVARSLATQIGAVHLRIDTIENAIRSSGVTDIRDRGYLVAYAVAGDNLRLGRTVIADSVNPLRITRSAWLEVARQANAKAIEVEMVCSDELEHRRRLESRNNDGSAAAVTWADVVSREYEPWSSPHLVVDAYRHGVQAGTDLILEYLHRTIPDLSTV